MQTSHKKLITLVVITLTSLLLTSCNTMAVRGSGSAYEVSHNIDNIERVQIKGQGELRLVNGSENQLIVFAQDELHQHLHIRQSGSQLIIQPKDGYHFKDYSELRFLLISNQLNAIDVSGSVDITSNNYQSTDLHLDISGSSDVDLSIDSQTLSIDASGSFDGYLSGTTDQLILDFSGSADLNAYDLIANQVDLDVSGASTAFVYAAEQLNVSARGASNVTYKGNPRVSHSSAGASRVNAAQ